MSPQRPVPNVNHDLERAMAAEAVYAFDRYLAFSVAPVDYSLPALRDVTQAAADAWEADGLVDVHTVAKHLQRVGKLAAIGGMDGLTDLLVSSAVPDADEFKRLLRLRRLRESALKLAMQAERGDLEGALTALGEAQTRAIDTSDAGEVIDLYDMGMELLRDLREPRSATPLYHLGWELLTRATGLAEPGTMLTIGAGTNVGKTSVTMELLIRAAYRGVRGGFVSCEDPKGLLRARAMTAFTGVSSRRLQQRDVSEEDWPRLGRGGAELERLRGKIGFAYPIGASDIDVCACMSRLAMRGAKLIVVDYVQAIVPSVRQQDRRNEVGFLSRRLKAHAKRLGVVLILLSQLNRPKQGDEFREPTKHDLKEAGELENDSDWVVLLWREREDDFAPVYAKLAKGKSGGIGARWQMQRDESSARLEEVEGSYQSAYARRQAGHQ